MKSLTDDRVRYEKAPFDHPEISVPHGHDGDQASVISSTLYPNLLKMSFDNSCDRRKWRNRSASTI